MSPPLAPPAELIAEGLRTGGASEAMLPLALAVITLGMGLSLGRADFTRIGREPRAVGIGALGQVLLLPAMAVLVALVFHRVYGLSAALTAGLLLLACCPGGSTSNLVTYLARADTALSVTLTSVMSFASVITTPLIFAATTSFVLGDGEFVRVSFVDTAKLVLVVVAIPILIGMFIRSRWPSVADSLEKPFRIASTVFLALVILSVILQNGDRFFDLAAQSIPAALALNVLALGGAWLLAHAAKLPERQARAVTIEVGFQNGTLGIALAVTQLGSAEAAIVPGFYSLVMFATGGALAYWWSRETPAGDGESEIEVTAS